MTEIEELIRKFNDLVANLVSKNANDVDKLVEKLNTTITQCSLQLNVLTKIPFSTEQTLLSIKKLLLFSSSLSSSSSTIENLDYDTLSEFLNILINLTSFEDILKIFNIGDLQMALKSGTVPLIQSACLIISNSYPKGIFASTIIFDILLDLYFNEDISISIINEIDKIWVRLLSDQLIRDNILKNNYKLLEVIKKNLKPTPTVRLLNLLNILLENMHSQNEFNSNIFIFSNDTILKILHDDILLFLHIIKYYSEWFTYIRNNQNYYWLLEYLKPIIFLMGSIFDQRDQYPDLIYFAKIPVFKFFQEVSYLPSSSIESDMQIFKDLDEKYLHVSIENEFINDYLSFINPDYLYRFYRSIIDNYVVLTATQLPIFRNLILSKSTFELIQNKLDAESILSLPYLEQMVLLEKMTKYEYSINYLIYQLPKVMTNLIDNNDNHIKEPETVQLRSEIIDALIKLSPEVLNVWYKPLKAEYVKVCNNVDTNRVAQPIVASSFSQ
ncbi:hypothetical protein RI543_001883 [Arxiozyma heterogenica]|uniref:DNA mismatch repair protein HSM3 n=1 Tax=Arxiozyma heterogenica TaxID=278026 RepID=A0AAN8A8V0_9SACH|nr:hypothetical protein RI543_001883 [Kazachstania heterogenica]